MSERKFILKQDVWYIEDTAKNSIGSCLTKKELDELVVKIGEKGEKGLYDPEYDENEVEFDCGSFDISDKDFVEEVK